MRACDGKYSEDVYYKMCLQDRYEEEYERYYHTPSYTKQTKQQPNQYARKQIGKKRLNKLYGCSGWWVIHNKGEYKKKCYINSSKYHKRYSNKKVRRYKNFIGNGGDYRKLYDYWWEVL